MGEKFETIPPRREAVPATDFISVERKFTEVRVFARPLAELVAPPTVRHQCRNVLHNDRKAASSHPRAVEGNFVEVAGSWTEEGDEEFYHDALA